PDRIAVASGPNLALEIAREQPTAAVISSRSQETADVVARAARNSYFRTFVNTDVIGTEFGGVLKNLIAVAIGIVDPDRIAVASGPNLALEIAREQPTAAVISSRSQET
ncbi:hypothetical protein CTI14_57100, partial [Methylobacterium radiotolerans]